ncbi:DUF6510 family protein [Rathayibacter sp. YIM 133350]|uniref:DUF6510 family protein n=1 Tax=Rathayibacter sp. YIM 133350 TaxID=3131992 RepID=UPI00307E5677
MTHVDGNELAGAFAELFAFDVTTASARCAGCGAVDVLATAMVYTDAPGTVARCPHCDAVLATLVQGDDRVWFSLSGLSAVQVPRPAGAQ